MNVLVKKPKLLEAKNGFTLSELLDTGEYKSVLLPFVHGVGDTIMFLPILVKLRKLYPQIQIDVGLLKGLDEETLIPEAILLEGDWREKALTFGYDLVYPVNFPLERIEDETKTKSEICCIEELGIEPVSGHIQITAKKMVAVSFQMTSIPWVANAEREVALKIWNEIKEAGFTPIECIFQHVFHNPANEKYDFIDTHMRACTPRIETLISILGSCCAFVGVVSGNFHAALSVLGKDKVMLLERDLKVGHFTKETLAHCDIKNYQDGTVKLWLENVL